MSKPLLLSILCLSMAACTQNSVVKNTALRYVVLQFDEKLSKNSDADVIQKVKKKTQIEVTDLKMISDQEAMVQVHIQTVRPEKLQESQSQEVQVHLVKAKGWSVKE